MQGKTNTAKCIAAIKIVSPSRNSFGKAKEKHPSAMMLPLFLGAVLLGGRSLLFWVLVGIGAAIAVFIAYLLIKHWRRAFGGRSVPFEDPSFWNVEAQNPTHLLVCLHAYGVSPRTLDQVKAEARKQFPAAHLFSPQLPFHIFSRANFNVIARDVIAAINEWWRRHGNDQVQIILIGHSLGALLARKVYVVACGETTDAPFETEFAGTTAQWSHRVNRVVLLAAMNRGWRISHHLSITNALVLSVGVFLGRIVELLGRRHLMVMQLKRGAPGLTQLRLQWLAMRQAAAERGRGGALTVQLLGTIDDLVGPDDSVDLVSGEDFIYLEVPRSDHLSLIYVNGNPARLHKPEERAYAAGRAGFFRAALTESREDLTKRRTDLGHSPEHDPSVDHVIFVVHGIRDEGYWTQKIARYVKTEGQADATNPKRNYAMVTSSYGYFPMAPFLIPGSRRKKVEWLMDQYAQAVARYPNARGHFSCIAHSNGTYLVAKALQEYPAVRFERIIFAGSVVRRNFRWERFEGRVKQIVNYVATGDWVVACFPKLFEHLRVQDLGSAGHDGFGGEEAQLLQVRFVRGGHSAALGEEHWQHLAKFIVHGKLPEGSGEQSPVWKRIGRVPEAVWIGILIVLALIGWGLFHLMPTPELRTLALVIYIWLIWKLLNWL
jgi:pimeloyl-ACP methyl ester carboxylesterase